MEKKLAHTVKQVCQEYPQAVVEVWTQDEHRIGLKPVLRRVWTPIGEQPIAKVHQRYEWLWLYGFVEPESGQTYWWILPRTDTQLFSRVLADFAQAMKLSKDKRVVLVLDQARWHISDKLEVPEGIHLMFLPPYSPELQPAERLWPLTNEPIANRYFETLDELEEVLVKRCQVLMAQPRLIQGYTCFHWWPTIAEHDK